MGSGGAHGRAPRSSYVQSRDWSAKLLFAISHGNVGNTPVEKHIHDPIDDHGLEVRRARHRRVSRFYE
jgi:hypothetical protein